MSTEPKQMHSLEEKVQDLEIQLEEARRELRLASELAELSRQTIQKLHTEVAVLTGKTVSLSLDASYMKCDTCKTNWSKELLEKRGNPTRPFIPRWGYSIAVCPDCSETLHLGKEEEYRDIDE